MVPIERIEIKLDNLASKLLEHMEQDRSDLNDLKVAVARLEEKVGFHQKGLGAVSVAVVSAIFAVLTSALWKLFKL